MERRSVHSVSYYNYAELFSFLQALKYNTLAERETFFKIVEIYKVDPDKALALLDTIITAMENKSESEQLKAEMQRVATSSDVEIKPKLYG